MEAVADRQPTRARFPPKVKSNLASPRPSTPLSVSRSAPSLYPWKHSPSQAPPGRALKLLAGLLGNEEGQRWWWWS